MTTDHTNLGPRQILRTEKCHMYADNIRVYILNPVYIYILALKSSYIRVLLFISYFTHKDGELHLITTI